MENYCTLLTRRNAPTPQVFLTPDGSGWRFPPFSPEQDLYHTNAQAANALIQAQLGMAVVTRQSLRLPEPALGGPLNIYVVERRGDQTQEGVIDTPAIEGRWFAPENLSEIALTLPKERAVLAAWFAEAEGKPIPSLHLPYWQEGWFDDAAQRLLSYVTDFGRTALAPVEQIRSAYTSSLLRVRTNEGHLYLKTIPAAFAPQEIALTQMLAQQDFTHYPVVLAAAKDHLLLEDMGAHRPLGSDVPFATWEAVVRFYGQLQASSVNQIPQWLAMGCVDLRTETIRNRFEALANQVPERLDGLRQQLSPEELARLQDLSALVQTLCRELAGYGIPDSLEHGDLHAGNVAVREKDFVLYDWSHACVTCPFYGFGSLLLDDDWFPGEPDACSRLRDAYLESWMPYASRERLQSAFALWSRLRPLFLAAHQSDVIEAYQTRMGSPVYAAETATGNALQEMQWWLAGHWRNLLTSLGEADPAE